MPAASKKKMTMREFYESLRKRMKKNNGKTNKRKKDNSSYTFTGHDENGLNGSYYLQH